MKYLAWPLIVISICVMFAYKVHQDALTEREYIKQGYIQRWHAPTSMSDVGYYQREKYKDDYDYKSRM